MIFEIMVMISLLISLVAMYIVVNMKATIDTLRDDQLLLQKRINELDRDLSILENKNTVEVIMDDVGVWFDYAQSTTYH